MQYVIHVKFDSGIVKSFPCGEDEVDRNIGYWMARRGVVDVMVKKSHSQYSTGGYQQIRGSSNGRSKYKSKYRKRY